MRPRVNVPYTFRHQRKLAGEGSGAPGIENAVAERREASRSLGPVRALQSEHADEDIPRLTALRSLLFRECNGKGDGKLRGKIPPREREDVRDEDWAV